MRQTVLYGLWSHILHRATSALMQRCFTGTDFSRPWRSAWMETSRWIPCSCTNVMLFLSPSLPVKGWAFLKVTSWRSPVTDRLVTCRLLRSGAPCYSVLQISVSPTLRTCTCLQKSIKLMTDNVTYSSVYLLNWMSERIFSTFTWFLFIPEVQT